MTKILRLSMMGIGLLALLFSFAGSGVKATTSSCGAWSVVASPNTGIGDTLRAVAAVSTKDVWAVGYAITTSTSNAISFGSTGGINQTLIEHWNGFKWSIVASQNVGTGDNMLSGVAVVSPNNVWAVGSSYNHTTGASIQTLIEHWNGTNWSVIASPNPGSSQNLLHAVTAISASNIWTVGDSFSNGSQQTLIEHWNGTSWSVVASPTPGPLQNTLSSVAAVSATNIWAVGYYSTNTSLGQTLVEHWNGAKWSVVASPSPGSGTNTLNSIAVISANNIWAAGGVFPTDITGQTLIEHWNGTNWSVVTSPNPTTDDSGLNGIATVSTNSIWTVGSSYNSSTQQNPTMIEHWNGSTWSIVASPSPGTVNNSLTAIAHVPNSNQLWAVGTYSSGGTQKTLTEIYR